MRKVVSIGLTLLLFILTGTFLALSNGQQEEDKPISWENWKAAKNMAEKYDSEGKYVEALQYYLEYSRQAEGLKRPDLVAWGKNNAAYMIIKRHKLDSSVDLEPAKKLLTEAMAIDQASEECRRVLERNMEYVKLFLKD